MGARKDATESTLDCLEMAAGASSRRQKRVMKEAMLSRKGASEKTDKEQEWLIS